MPPIAQLPRSSDSNFSFEQAVTRQELEEMSVDYLEPPSTGEKFSVYRDKDDNEEANSQVPQAQPRKCSLKKNSNNNRKKSVQGGGKQAMNTTSSVHIRSKSDPAVAHDRWTQARDMVSPTKTEAGLSEHATLVAQLSGISHHRMQLLAELHQLDQQEREILERLLRADGLPAAVSNENALAPWQQALQYRHHNHHHGTSDHRPNQPQSPSPLWWQAPHGQQQQTTTVSGWTQREPPLGQSQRCLWFSGGGSSRTPLSDRTKHTPVLGPGPDGKRGRTAAEEGAPGGFSAESAAARDEEYGLEKRASQTGAVRGGRETSTTTRVLVKLGDEETQGGHEQGQQHGHGHGHGRGESTSTDTGRSESAGHTNGANTAVHTPGTSRDYVVPHTVARKYWAF